MAAFLVAGIGKARDLGRAITATFPLARELSNTAWIVCSDDDATVQSITRQIKTSDSMIVLRIELAEVHGLADSDVWAFIEQAAKPKRVATASSIFDAQIGMERLA